MIGGYNEQRYRRTWFPDEQVAPELVLEALKARRQLATTDARVIPWMSAADIGITLGLVKDGRWRPEHLKLEDLLTPDPKVCRRCIPWGLRWRHPVAQRDVLAALNHYQAEGQVFRLPHPMATWGVYFTPLDDVDRDAIINAWAAMEEARENSRHAVRKYKLGVARLAQGRTP